MDSFCFALVMESEVAQSCLTLCDPMHCSLPGSSVHGTFQARVLEWGAIAFSESSHIISQKEKKKALLISIIELLDKLSRLSTCHFPCSLPGSSVHGILQARILEGFAISSSRASSWHWDPGIEPTYLMSPALAGGFFTTRATWEGCFPRFLINCLMHCMNQIMFFEDRDIGMNA